MSNDLTSLKPAGIQLPAAFAGKTAAAVFQNVQMETGSEGIEGSYGIIKYAGKVWSLQYRGENRKFMRPDGDGPRGSIDAIFIRMADNKAKTFYKTFVEGSKEKPICWSNDGARPDAAVPPSQKQAPACAACPRNVFGSRVTDDGKQAKECSDHKRTAIILDPALVQSVLGMPLAEPVMLRIPAASLNDFSTFADTMNAQGFKLQTFVCKIGFDPSKNFPKFKFEAVRPLSEEEGAIVLAFRDSVEAKRIISDSVVVADGAEEPAPHPGQMVQNTGPNLGTNAGSANNGAQGVTTAGVATNGTDPGLAGQGVITGQVVQMPIAPRPEAMNPNPPQNVTGPTAVAERPTPEQQAAAMAAQAQPEPGAGPVTTDFDADINARLATLLG